MGRNDNFVTGVIRCVFHPSLPPLSYFLPSPSLLPISAEVFTVEIIILGRQCAAVLRVIILPAVLIPATPTDTAAAAEEEEAAYLPGDTTAE